MRGADYWKLNSNLIVPWYLMASYAYYILAEPLMTDEEYDQLATEFLEKYDTLTHRHKELVTKEMLKAGSYLGEYPSIVKGATIMILNPDMSFSDRLELERLAG